MGILDANIEEARERMQARYGENHRITGDYDKSLAVRCVNGTFVGVKDGDVIAYKGIPFVGEQPVGKNRFKKPVPFTADYGVYEAYHFAKAAPQEANIGDAGTLAINGEDCLYLNIWKNAKDTSDRKPVMVWIHGGAYVQGTPVNPLYDGFNFVKDNGDVILVTIPYRLSGLGFIYLSHLPDGKDYPDAQNLGILDQMMALKWVYENIKGFGGDPDNITIFGESAGGGSVSLLPLIPEARKYIRRVIAQSGEPTFSISKEMAISNANTILKELNCKTVADLCAVDALKLSSLVGTLFGFSTAPVRDGKLIPLEPYEVYATGELKDIDILHGCTRDEFGQFVHFAHAQGGFEAFIAMFGPRFEESISTLEPEDAKRAKEFMEVTEGEEYEKYARFGDQTWFIAPAFRVSENHTAAGGKAFQYLFRVESAHEHFHAGHASELASVFNNPQDTFFTGRPFDDTFNHIMQRMWVTFAKTGDPSLSAEESPTGKAIKWDCYDSGTKPIMVFDEFDVHEDSENELHILDWERTYPLTKYYIL